MHMNEYVVEKLLPCPFCGGTPERAKKHVYCSNCGAQGPYTSDDIDDLTAEIDWNKRIDGLYASKK